MAPHWKCGSGQPVAGSNPALSAISPGVAIETPGASCVQPLLATMKDVNQGSASAGSMGLTGMISRGDVTYRAPGVAVCMVTRAEPCRGSPLGGQHPR